MHGLQLLDPIVDGLADAFIEMANDQARKMITSIVRPILEKEVKNFKLG